MKWALKIATKLVLARLPVPYGFWKTVGLFRHGRMDAAAYTLKVFNMHIARAYPQGVPQNAVFLELGPGDSVASCLLASGLGVARTYLVDVGSFSRQDVGFYKKIVTEMHASGAKVPDLSSVSSFPELLHVCNADYLTSGLQGLKEIPSNSVDFIWSHSVLEHVRKNDVESTLRELLRILKPGGLSSHNIDYQDHLNHGLNNLRFSEKVWESKLFARSGFYTNRIPAVRMHEMFKQVGFCIVEEAFGKWDIMPLREKYINSEFGSYSISELMNRTSYVLLRKPA